MLLKFLQYGFIMCVLQSCIMQAPTVNFTQINKNDTCLVKPKSIFLFFDGEKNNFDFKSIGLVEVIGTTYSTDEELINRLKYQAYQNCANAVVNVQLSSISKITSGSKYPTSYFVKRYSGLAVQIPDSIYKSNKFGAINDINYISAIAGYEKQANDTFAASAVATTVFGACVRRAFGASPVYTHPTLFIAQCLYSLVRPLTQLHRVSSM